MNELKELIKAELKKSGVSKTDVLKFIFQNEFGPGHSIDNPIDFEIRLKSEFDEIEACGNTSLYEPLGNGYVRLNLKRLKFENIDSEFISKLAILSSTRSGNKDDFVNKVNSVSDLIDLKEELEVWKNMEEPLFSHSNNYKAQQNPHYIVTNEKFINMWDLLMKIRSLREKPAAYIAIDGRCGSGKSIMAYELSYIFDGQVIKMDDFFLPFELRSPERLSEPGGNVHYERFKLEVMEPLLSGKNPCYGVFSCKTMSINSYDLVLNKRYIFVEGSYSLREDLRELFDLGVFVDVRSEEQLRRIEERNGQEALKNFVTRWIPMEERYFEKCNICDVADYSIDTTDTKI